MDSPETSAALGTQDTERRQITQKHTTQKINKTSNTNHEKKGVNPGARVE